MLANVDLLTKDGLADNANSQLVLCCCCDERS